MAILAAPGRARQARPVAPRRIDDDRPLVHWTRPLVVVGAWWGVRRQQGTLVGVVHLARPLETGSRVVARGAFVALEWSEALSAGIRQLPSARFARRLHPRINIVFDGTQVAVHGGSA